MNSNVYVLGIDPGLANMGVALVSIGATEAEDRVERLMIFRTEKSDKKKGILAAADMMERGRLISGSLKTVFRDFPGAIKAVCTESFSPPRNASAAAKIALSFGVLLAVLDDLPLLQVSPQDLKKKVAQSKTASKEDVQKALDERFSGVPAALLCDKRIANSYREHAYDALGAVVGCLDSDLIRMVRGLKCKG